MTELRSLKQTRERCKAACSQHQKPGSSSSMPGAHSRRLRPPSHPREDGQAGVPPSPPRWQRRGRAASGRYSALSRGAAEPRPASPPPRGRAADPPHACPAAPRPCSAGRRAEKRRPKRRFGFHGVCPERVPAHTHTAPPAAGGRGAPPGTPLPPRGKGRCNASLCRAAAERHSPPAQMCSPATAGEEPAGRTVKEGQLRSHFPWAGGKAGVVCSRPVAPGQKSGKQAGSQSLRSKKHLTQGLKTLCLPTSPVPANLLETALL